MNLIFGVCVTLCTVLLLFSSPDAVLTAFLSGGEKALSLALRLAVVYAVWLGVFGVLESTGLAKKFAKLFTPMNRLLFGRLTEKENEYISLNVSANMLGMTGATTPMGIAAIRELEKRGGTERAIALFFVVNATSIQLIPTSVMALRATLGSASPGDILVPTLLATTLSSAVGTLLTFLFYPVKAAKTSPQGQNPPVSNALSPAKTGGNPSQNISIKRLFSRAKKKVTP